MTNPPPRSRAPVRRTRLLRRMLKTVGAYDLIAEGDRILVAVSGGKDSSTLLDLLCQSRTRSPVGFEIVAFHLDQGHPGYDDTAFAAWLESTGVPFRIHREDTYSQVVAQAALTGSSLCAPCARFRRGILYTWAERLGCNKVALGHHLDDALQTLLLNLFYSGKLQAMPPCYRTQDDRFDVIRPLVECAEDDIAEHARDAGYPIVPCRLCGSQPDTKRVRAARLISELEVEIPDLKTVMLRALKNVRPSHLLDREVADAWEAVAERYAPRR